MVGALRLSLQPQLACSPLKCSKVHPTRATHPMANAIMNSHQPTARPAKANAAEKPRASGHHELGVKKP